MKLLLHGKELDAKTPPTEADGVPCNHDTTDYYERGCAFNGPAASLAGDSYGLWPRSTR